MNRRKIAVILLCAASLIAIGATRTAKTHIMDVELARPVRGAEGIQILNVTIFEDVAADRAANMLRSQLEATVAAFNPSDGILASAWDSEENQIGQSLIYVADEKKIMTMDEYEASRKK